MNQEQYHASLLNKGQPVGLGWDGITKATQPKAFPPEPPNNTDPDESIRRVKEDDHTLIDLNWNNIKVSVVYQCPRFSGCLGTRIIGIICRALFSVERNSVV